MTDDEILLALFKKLLLGDEWDHFTMTSGTDLIIDSRHAMTGEESRAIECFLQENRPSNG